MRNGNEEGREGRWASQPHLIGSITSCRVRWWNVAATPSLPVPPPPVSTLCPAVSLNYSLMMLCCLFHSIPSVCVCVPLIKLKKNPTMVQKSHSYHVRKSTIPTWVHLLIPDLKARHAAENTSVKHLCSAWEELVSLSSPSLLLSLASRMTCADGELARKKKKKSSHSDERCLDDAPRGCFPGKCEAPRRAVKPAFPSGAVSLP